jgi:S-adenosylmethionine-diacylgycerolhomoserine-N-methlytransferase
MGELIEEKQAKLMDHVYHVQRHFYDITRRLFLPGRDRLVKRIIVPAGGAVLEIGCGTARNLLILARRFPEVQFYGIDISNEMLLTASRKIQKSGLKNIHIARADAQNFDPHELFHLDSPLDVVFFSYSLSMIPDWRKALDLAITLLNPTGRLFLVDFWDQQNWPSIIRRLLVRWLALFHVRYEPMMIDYLKTLAVSNAATFELQAIFHRYAFLASISR